MRCAATLLAAASRASGLRLVIFFFSSRRRHTRLQGDWSSDVCSSDLSLAEARELLERTDQQINRLNYLVNQLLDISRVQYDRLEIYKEPCDLVAVAQEIGRASCRERV